MKFYRLISLLLAFILTVGAGIYVYAEESGDNGTVSEDNTPPTNDDSGDSPVPDDSSTTTENNTQGGYAIKYGYRPLVAYDGAKASDYIKGPTPPTAYVSPGGSHTVANNHYTFRDYVFAGWSCGGKIYKPGDVIYNINSSMTLIAEWVRPPRPDMTVIGILSYADGDEILNSVSVPVGSTITIDDGAWQDEEGRIFSGGSKFLLSFSTVDFQKYSGSDNTVKISYNGNGASTGIQCSFKAVSGTPFTVDGCYAVRDGYSFIGWKDGNGKIYLSGDTCTATEDTVFTAQWQEQSKPAPDYCSVSVNVGEGGKADPTGKTTVVKGDRITVNVSADKGYKLISVVRDGTELGTGGSYTLTVNADTALDITFEYVGGDTEPGESKGENGESVDDASSDKSQMPDEDTSPAESQDDSNKGSTNNNDDSKNGIVLALAILLCVACIGFCGWFVAKALRGKKKTAKRRR